MSRTPDRLDDASVSTRKAMVREIVKDALIFFTAMVFGFIARDWFDVNLLYWILTGRWL